MVDNNDPLPPIPDPFYPPPEWAKLPEKEWLLIEIKGGVEMERYPLHRRPSWLIGRAADQVHIALGHESISRFHARIAFDSNGVPWLRDCQSSHGVTVNKKRLPPAATGTVESNSTKPGCRGVTLFPGDVISFGASTRIYCIEGPPEYQRGSIRVPKAVVPQNPLPVVTLEEEAKDNTANESEEKEDLGVSWGITMEESANYNENNDEESHDVILKRQAALEDGANIPDKHRKAWEKIVALKYKLKNVLTESERIERKGELTTGQEHQLQRNQQRSQELQEKITERERDLYEKLYPEERGSNTKKRRRKNDMLGGDDEDVDDFFDRTKDDQSSSNIAGDGETEASLLEKWNTLQTKRRLLTAAWERASQKVVGLQQRLERLQAAGDDDVFFAQNDLTLAKEQAQKIEKDQEAIVKELEETKRLLKIVNPKLMLREESESVDSSAAMAPLPGRKIVDETTDASSVMPPPSFRPETEVSPLTKEISTAPGNNDDGGFMMPPPKRIKAAGPIPSLPEKAATIDEEKVQSKTPVTTNSNNVSKPVKGPTRPPTAITGGTLAALAAATASGVRTKHSHQANESGSYVKNQQEKQATTIDLQTDIWQAPKDQDGSGMTEKQKAKFAGRY